MRLIRRIEHLLACGYLRRGLARMHRHGREQADPAVAMRVVIPIKKGSRPGACVLQAAKAVRVARALFQRLELGLRKGVVVGDMRATVGFGHPQIDEQGRNRFCGHRAPPVGVNS